MPSRPLCTLTSSHLPPETCAALVEQNNLNQNGKDAVPATLTLKVGEPYTFRYAIGGPAANGSVSDATQQALRRTVAPGGGDVLSGDAVIGHFTYAVLTTDPSIAVKPYDPKQEVQEVNGTQRNQQLVWLWTLTPSREGSYPLKLDVGVELRADDGSTPVRIKSPVKVITLDVKVGRGAALKKGAEEARQWLGLSTQFMTALAAFFTAMGAAYAAFRAIRNRKAAAAATDGTTKA